MNPVKPIGLRHFKILNLSVMKKGEVNERREPQTHRPSNRKERATATIPNPLCGIRPPQKLLKNKPFSFALSFFAHFCLKTPFRQGFICEFHRHEGGYFTTVSTLQQTRLLLCQHTYLVTSYSTASSKWIDGAMEAQAAQYASPTTQQADPVVAPPPAPPPPPPDDEDHQALVAAAAAEQEGDVDHDDGDGDDEEVQVLERRKFFPRIKVLLSDEYADFLKR
jgi:hypothetical protein